MRPLQFFKSSNDSFKDGAIITHPLQKTRPTAGNKMLQTLSPQSTPTTSSIMSRVGETPKPKEQTHEALNPVHPSVLPYLDPDFITLYNENVAPIPNAPIDLYFLRSKYSVLYSYGTGPAPEAAKTYDTKVPGYNGVEIGVRVYEPTGPGPWPCHIDFHGGGWGLGDLDTESHILKHITHNAYVCTIDVAYRLLPEIPFPTGILDSFAAVSYIHSHPSVFNIDASSITIGGVSAGGNIAIVCAHLARDANIPIKAVIAGTPTIDDISRYPSASDSPFPSMQQMEFAPTLNWARLKYFDSLKQQSLAQHYKTEEEKKAAVKWYLNAFDAPRWDGLCKHVIYTAGCDPLRDEGEAYAKMLCQKGGLKEGEEVVVRRFDGVPHPFMHMDASLSQARDFIQSTWEEIGKAHGTL